MRKSSQTRTVQQLNRIKLTDDIKWNVGDVVIINKINEDTIIIKRVYNTQDNKDL